MGCTCGVPSEANYYTFVVIGCDTDTDYVDAYTCEEHKGRPKELVPDGWKVLEWRRTQLR